MSQLTDPYEGSRGVFLDKEAEAKRLMDKYGPIVKEQQAKELIKKYRRPIAAEKYDSIIKRIDDSPSIANGTIISIPTWWGDKDNSQGVNISDAKKVIKEALSFRVEFGAKDIENKYDFDEYDIASILNHFVKDWALYKFYAPNGYYEKGPNKGRPKLRATKTKK